VHPGYFSPPELALKGPRDTAIIGSARLNRTARAFLAPSASGRNLYFRLTQGKPGVNPGLSYFGHFGPRIGNVQTPGPGLTRVDPR
ncbi:MAG TPA: hypothetical protein VK775_18785, partial [Chthoniobacterales bacterium]|nr:hypothetical protein [Chthoniobacterales bacterium]